MSNIVNKDTEEAELRNKIKYLTDLINNASQQKSQKPINHQRTERVQRQRVQVCSNTSNNNVKTTTRLYLPITGNYHSLQKSKSDRYVWKKRSPSTTNILDTNCISQFSDVRNIQNKTTGNQSTGSTETKNINSNFDSINPEQKCSFKRNVSLPQRHASSVSVGTSRNFVFQQTLSSGKNVSDTVKNSLSQGQSSSAAEIESHNADLQQNMILAKNVSETPKNPLPKRQVNMAKINASLKFVSQQNFNEEKNVSDTVKNSLPQGQINTAKINTSLKFVSQQNYNAEKSVLSNVKNSKYKLGKKDSSVESACKSPVPLKSQETLTVKLTLTKKDSDFCENPENKSVCCSKSENKSQIKKGEKNFSSNTVSGNLSGSSEYKKFEDKPTESSNILSCIQSNSQVTDKKLDKKNDAISPSKKSVVEMLNKQLTMTSDNLQKIKKNLSQTLLVNKQDRNDIPKTKQTTSRRQSSSSYGNPTNLPSSSQLRQSEFKSKYKYQKTKTDHDIIDSRAKLSPFSHSHSLQKKSQTCPQTQVVANVIKSKYKIGSYQTNWNKLCKNVVKHPNSSSSGRLNTTINMKKFYDKMAKKYGWTDLDPTKQKINMKKFYAKMAKKYGWTDLDSSSTSKVNMKKFQLKMTQKYGWTDKDLKKSGFHTVNTISHTRLSHRHAMKSHAHQTASFFINKKYRHIASLPHASRMILDRRKLAPKPLIKGLRKGTHLVLLNGVLYSSNRTTMSKVVTGRGDIVRKPSTMTRYTVNWKLKRNHTSLLPHGPIESTNRLWNTRFLASKAINRSIAMATAKCKKNKESQRQYCMFYNRFGRCNRGSNCPYVHDPDRIAVCTRFLRGTCKVVDCPFSHKVAKEKMPVCTYFLKGVCNRDGCPYLHVNVSRSAIICPDFLNGYCSLGEKCKKKHTRICPEFLAKGTCSDKKKCNLIHIKSGGERKKRKIISKPSEQRDDIRKSPTDTAEVKNRKRDMVEESDNDLDIPFKYRKLPTYISLESNQGDRNSDLKLNAQREEKKAPDVKGIRIKPQF